MNTDDFISVNQLTVYYNIEKSFFTELNEIGLIEISTIEESEYIPLDQIAAIEKMVRMRQDLALNIEGIDVVFNLLKKIDHLQDELNAAKRRLRLYEGGED
jgi:hypothetical protein